MMKIVRHHMEEERGFTLVEMLIYVVVATTVGIAVVQSLLNFSEALSRLSVKEDLNQSARVAMERMIREIRDAHDVYQPDSVLDTDPGILVLDMASAIGTSQLTFNGTSSQLTVTDTNGNTETLIRSNVTLDYLIFEYFEATNTDAEIIRIVMTLTATNGDYQQTETFYGSAVLRRSY